MMALRGVSRQIGAGLDTEICIGWGDLALERISAERFARIWGGRV